jgi:general secretion pathway protein A
MYTRYFGLTEKPFAIAPNPRYLYMSELHKEALAHLLYGINEEGCIILLTGDVGTGKTTVCRFLIDQLPETTDVAIILNPELTITDLLKTICEELAIPISEPSPSVKTYTDNLNTYLFDAHSKGKNTTLIIDEAQNLDIEVLEQVRLLTNVETNSHKLLQVVLIGQPELRNKITDPTLIQLNQRVTSRYHLKPLQPEAVYSYIHHRINVAGGDPRNVLFSKKAIRHIIKISNGIPRVINTLCDRALLGAYAENKDHVDLSIMKKAAREVVVKQGREPLSLRTILLTFFILLFSISLTVTFYFSSNNSDTALLKQFKWPFTATESVKIHPVQVKSSKSSVETETKN